MSAPTDRRPPAAPVPDRVRRPARGYALVATGATLFAVNAAVARFLLEDGVSALRLSQLRSFGSLLILVAVLAIARPGLLRVERRDLPALAFLGIAGLALVHAAYFIAIERLQIGVAVTLEYLAPLLVLLWLRIFHGRRLAPGLWAAVVLSLVGCFLVVRAYDARSLDALGVAAGLIAAIAYATYMVSSERAGHRHHPFTTLVWGFAFASLFWALVTPWWSFPFADFASARNATLALAVIVVGTLLPFGLIVAGVRDVPASRAAVVATLEPVLAALLAYLVHDEGLAAVQVAGGVVVLAAVAWVQAHAPDGAAEAAPLRARTR